MCSYQQYNDLFVTTVRHQEAADSRIFARACIVLGLLSPVHSKAYPNRLQSKANGITRNQCAVHKQL